MILSFIFCPTFLPLCTHTPYTTHPHITPPHTRSTHTHAHTTHTPNTHTHIRVPPNTHPQHTHTYPQHTHTHTTNTPRHGSQSHPGGFSSVAQAHQQPRQPSHVSREGWGRMQQQWLGRCRRCRLHWPVMCLLLPRCKVCWVLVCGVLGVHTVGVLGVGVCCFLCCCGCKCGCVWCVRVY